MSQTLRNTWFLGLKELRSILRDPMLLMIIVLAFTVIIYSAASSMPESLHKTPIAVIDDDQSQLSMRLVSAFDEPYFLPPEQVSSQAADRIMDEGRFTFIVHIPSGFERDVLRQDMPELQVIVDATRMSQAFTGTGYIQAILQQTLTEFYAEHSLVNGAAIPVELALRSRFNPELNPSWFASMTEVIGQITMLSLILTGAALLREREHGTIEHLLVMPVTPFEIMFAKVWSMVLVVMIAATLSLVFVVQGILAIPIEGSLWLFAGAMFLHLFATTSMGIFMATFARTMPQFGLLLILVVMPMQILSGGMTPYESMPVMIQALMSAAPTTHFMQAGQAILFRGAEVSMIWPHLLALLVIGLSFFLIALARFRKTLATLV